MPFELCASITKKWTKVLHLNKRTWLYFLNYTYPVHSPWSIFIWVAMLNWLSEWEKQCRIKTQGGNTFNFYRLTYQSESYLNLFYNVRLALLPCLHTCKKRKLKFINNIIQTLIVESYFIDYFWTIFRWKKIIFQCIRYKNVSIYIIRMQFMVYEMCSSEIEREEVDVIKVLLKHSQILLLKQSFNFKRKFIISKGIYDSFVIGIQTRYIMLFIV